MGFKSRHRITSQMPEINLVPMMDVLMSILTFFIIISMTLTHQQSVVDVQLPGVGKGSATTQAVPDALTIALTASGQIQIGDNTVTREQVLQQVPIYLREDPQRVVLLKADRTLPYEQVVQLLGELRTVGGNRVSLAISQP
jgi:biopolymer transport protein ExbD